MFFKNEILLMAEKWKPSKHPFFSNLKFQGIALKQNPKKMGQLYLHYQAAMHATRAMVYCLPWLDAPHLRKRKLQIYIDDDGLPGGDTHHYQLSRAFQLLGAELPLADEAFGDLEILANELRPKTATFIKKVSDLYPKSLGAWVLMELVSDNFMHALGESLSSCSDKIMNEPYFRDCFANNIEYQHGKEALALASLVVKDKPMRQELTLLHVEQMGQLLNSLWDDLDEVLRDNRPID